jgi:hypothetical protein
MSGQRGTEETGRDADGRGLTAGIVFIVVGVGFLLDELGVLEVRVAYVLPLLLIATGVWILFGRTVRKERGR